MATPTRITSILPPARRARVHTTFPGASISTSIPATCQVNELAPRTGLGRWVGNPTRMTFLLARRTGPLVLIHTGAAAVLVLEAGLLAWLLVPAILYARGLAVTISYHRYFSHRSFKTSRVGQFALAVAGCLNVQNGPLWWAAHHRIHHRNSDREGDVHSPVRGGFVWAHCGWLFATLSGPDRAGVRDLSRYRELVWLERLWLLPSVVAIGLCWLLGGWAAVCVCFCLTAVVIQHMTFAVNSFGHLIGSRRYQTPDRSRNSFVLAVLTLGDGWHNNHHHYPHAAQAGFRWWEIDASFRLIRLAERLGLVWDVRRVPADKI